MFSQPLLRPAFMAMLFCFAIGQPVLAQPLVEMRYQVQGRWVLNTSGQSFPFRLDAYERGLQPSGLSYDGTYLWSVGDQRSEYPGHLLRIDPSSARLAEQPIPITVAREVRAEQRELDRFRRMTRIDLEAIASHPNEPSTLFAITENDVSWILELRVGGEVSSGTTATLVALTRLTWSTESPEPRPWSADLNYRFEGCAVGDETLFLAFERKDNDDLPQIYAIDLAVLRSNNTAAPAPIDFALDTVRPRTDRPDALLNINAIEFVRRSDRPYLIAAARDQERLLVLDLSTRRVTRTVDLDLLAPDGRRIKWVSPEGLAADSRNDRLWLINDPDSTRGNYHARAEDRATGRFASYTPLLFVLRLSRVLGGASSPSNALGAGSRGSSIASSDFPDSLDADPPHLGPIPAAAQPALCVFDYDLTLSTHGCVDPSAPDPLHCRTNHCQTYGWFQQCISPGARAAIAECVRREAFIGIASHASVDYCWSDKVTPLVGEMQFPEWLTSPHYASTTADWAYPALDDRANWNCAQCAYHMNPTISKSEAIRRIMLHYGLNPNSAAHRARVIFWDDSSANIRDVKSRMPESQTVLVVRDSKKSGCGLRQPDIKRGFSGISGALIPTD